MIGLLSKMHPDHEIFKKGYHPPKKERVQQAEPTIPNHNGFFDNLPPLSSSELRKGNGFKLNLLTKKQRKQQQLERLEEQEQRIAASKAKKQAELDDLEDEEDGIRLQVTKAEFDLIKRAKEAGLDQGHMQAADQNQQILTMA